MDPSNRSIAKANRPAPGKKPASHALPLEIIQRRIYLIRGRKVMLSNHLAELYDVEPRALVQTVKRNEDRFPADFMLQLSAEEFVDLKSQIVISSWGGSRTAPYAFTEQCVAVLSSVLRSKRGSHRVCFAPRSVNREAKAVNASSWNCTSGSIRASTRG